MKTFSKDWVASTKPKKQRKYRYNAPLHIKNSFLNVHLSKELRLKHGKRAVRARKGDKAKVIVGTFKGKIGTIEKVDIKKAQIFLSGVESIKKEGTKSLYPLQPSNLVLTELKLDDKQRKQKLENKKTPKKQEEKTHKKEVK